jgi:hypothetical protein
MRPYKFDAPCRDGYNLYPIRKADRISQALVVQTIEGAVQIKSMRFGRMIKAGTRYVTPGGAEMVVTKGGDGVLSDGEIPLQEKGSGPGFDGGGAPGEGVQVINLGRRYQSPDGAVSILVTKAGACDLRYNGEVMEVQQPRKLPSSD